MRNLKEHCHGSSHDAMRPPPLSELRCCAQKSSALLCWLDGHENKMAQKLVLCNEALTAWQRKWTHAEQEHEDVRTQSHAQQAQMQRLEHKLIAASTKHECCLEEQQEAVSDNQHMEQQKAALRGRLQCVQQELEAKSATMQRMMERIKSLQVELWAALCSSSVSSDSVGDGRGWARSVSSYSVGGGRCRAPGLRCGRCRLCYRFESCPSLRATQVR